MGGCVKYKYLWFCFECLIQIIDSAELLDMFTNSSVEFCNGLSRCDKFSGGCFAKIRLWIWSTPSDLTFFCVETGPKLYHGICVC